MPALDGLPFDLVFAIAQYIDAQDTIQLSMVSRNLHLLLDDSRAVWIAFIRRMLDIEGAAPHSIEFSSMSSTELKLCATRSARLWATLKRGSPSLERTQLRLPSTFLPPGSKHALLSGGRWLLTCAPANGQIYCWDLGTSEVGPPKPRFVPTATFRMPDPFECSQLEVRVRPKELDAMIVIYDKPKRCCHICTLQWSDDPSAPPNFEYEAKFDILLEGLTRSSPLSVEEYYVLLSGPTWLCVWSYQTRSTLYISLADPAVRELIPFSKVVGCLYGSQLLIHNSVDSSQCVAIHLASAFGKSPPEITASDIMTSSMPGCEGSVSQVSRDVTGFDFQGKHLPLFFAFDYHYHYRTVSFNPYVLEQLEQSNTVDCRQDNTTTNVRPLVLAARSSSTKSVVDPSRIYTSGNRVMVFGFPENQTPLMETENSTSSSVATPSKIGHSSEPRSSSSQTHHTSRFRRLLARFSVAKQTRTFTLTSLQSAVSTIKYELFETSVASSSTSSSQLRMQTGSPNEPLALSHPSSSPSPTPNSVPSLVSRPVAIGNLRVPGGELQKMREWCFVSGRMPSYADVPARGVFPREECAVDILTFR